MGDKTLSIVVEIDKTMRVVVQMENGKVVDGTYIGGDNVPRTLKVAKKYELCGYPYVVLKQKK